MNKHAIINEDVITTLRKIPDESVQLVIADPPYNINIEDWDNFSDYLDWASKWIYEIQRILKKEGNFVLFGGIQFHNKYTGDLLELIHHIRHNTNMRLQNAIIWYYKTGISAQRFFSNRHEEIMWFTKSDKYVFNLDEVRIPYDSETLALYSKDKRLNIETLQLGKNPTNVWEIPRLSSNSKERVGHPTQKPEQIIERIILSMSNDNDLVVDPFAGSCVTFKVAVENNRKSISCDIDPKVIEYSNLQRDKLLLYPYKLYENLHDFNNQINAIEL